MVKVYHSHYRRYCHYFHCRYRHFLLSGSWAWAFDRRSCSVSRLPLAAASPLAWSLLSVVASLLARWLLSRSVVVSPLAAESPLDAVFVLVSALDWVTDWDWAMDWVMGQDSATGWDRQWGQAQDLTRVRLSYSAL